MNFGFDVSKALDMIDVKEHRFTIIRQGCVLPVTKMFDGCKQETHNPMHAFACVAYVGGPMPWLVFKVTPGEIVARRT